MRPARKRTSSAEDERLLGLTTPKPTAAKGPSRHAARSPGLLTPAAAPEGVEELAGTAERSQTPSPTARPAQAAHTALVVDVGCFGVGHVGPTSLEARRPAAAARAADRPGEGRGSPTDRDHAAAAAAAAARAAAAVASVDGSFDSATVAAPLHHRRTGSHDFELQHPAGGQDARDAAQLSLQSQQSAAKPFRKLRKLAASVTGIHNAFSRPTLGAPGYDQLDEGAGPGGVVGPDGARPFRPRSTSPSASSSDGGSTQSGRSNPQSGGRGRRGGRGSSLQPRPAAGSGMRRSTSLLDFSQRPAGVTAGGRRGTDASAAAERAALWRKEISQQQAHRGARGGTRGRGARGRGGRGASAAASRPRRPSEEDSDDELSRWGSGCEMDDDSDDDGAMRPRARGGDVSLDFAAARPRSHSEPPLGEEYGGDGSDIEEEWERKIAELERIKAERKAAKLAEWELRERTEREHNMAMALRLMDEEQQRRVLEDEELSHASGAGSAGGAGVGGWGELGYAFDDDDGVLDDDAPVTPRSGTQPDAPDAPSTSPMHVARGGTSGDSDRDRDSGGGGGGGGDGAAPQPEIWIEVVVHAPPGRLGVKFRPIDRSGAEAGMVVHEVSSQSSLAGKLLENDEVVRIGAMESRRFSCRDLVDALRMAEAAESREICVRRRAQRAPAHVVPPTSRAVRVRRALARAAERGRALDAELIGSVTGAASRSAPALTAAARPLTPTRARTSSMPALGAATLSAAALTPPSALQRRARSDAAVAPRSLRRPTATWLATARLDAIVARDEAAERADAIVHAVAAAEAERGRRVALAVRRERAALAARRRAAAAAHEIIDVLVERACAQQQCAQREPTSSASSSPASPSSPTSPTRDGWDGTAELELGVGSFTDGAAADEPAVVVAVPFEDEHADAADAAPRATPYEWALGGGRERLSTGGLDDDSRSSFGVAPVSQLALDASLSPGGGADAPFDSGESTSRSYDVDTVRTPDDDAAALPSAGGTQPDARPGPVGRSIPIVIDDDDTLDNDNAFEPRAHEVISPLTSPVRERIATEAAARAALAAADDDVDAWTLCVGEEAWPPAPATIVFDVAAAAELVHSRDTVRRRRYAAAAFEAERARRVAEHEAARADDARARARARARATALAETERAERVTAARASLEAAAAAARADRDLSRAAAASAFKTALAERGEELRAALDDDARAREASIEKATALADIERARRVSEAAEATRANTHERLAFTSAVVVLAETERERRVSAAEADVAADAEYRARATASASALAEKERARRVSALAADDDADTAERAARADTARAAAERERARRASAHAVAEEEGAAERTARAASARIEAERERARRVGMQYEQRASEDGERAVQRANALAAMDAEQRRRVALEAGLDDESQVPPAPPPADLEWTDCTGVEKSRTDSVDEGIGYEVGCAGPSAVAAAANAFSFLGLFSGQDGSASVVSSNPSSGTHGLAGALLDIANAAVDEARSLPAPLLAAAGEVPKRSSLRRRSAAIFCVGRAADRSALAAERSANQHAALEAMDAEQARRVTAAVNDEAEERARRVAAARDATDAEQRARVDAWRAAARQAVCYRPRAALFALVTDGDDDESWLLLPTVIDDEGRRLPACPATAGPAPSVARRAATHERAEAERATRMRAASQRGAPRRESSVGCCGAAGNNRDGGGNDGRGGDGGGGGGDGGEVAEHTDRTPALRRFIELEAEREARERSAARAHAARAADDERARRLDDISAEYVSRGGMAAAAHELPTAWRMRISRSGSIFADDPAAAHEQRATSETRRREAAAAADDERARRLMDALMGRTRPPKLPPPPESQSGV